MPEQSTDRPVMTPGPDHPITVEPNPMRVRVWAAGKVIADSESSLTLREASYPPVEYLPLEDVEASLLQATDHASYCPFKGEAGYYSLLADPVIENAVWQYNEPYPAVAEIKGRVAFYPDRIERIEQLPR
jgi:uncharacterized protein (DUF427 family)